MFTGPLFVALFMPKLCPRLKGAAVVSMFAAFVTAVTLVMVGWLFKDKVYSDSAPIGAFVVSGLCFGLPFVYTYFRYRKVA